MKLITLTAKNFKKLSDFSCNFQDGLNVIVGDNAQGKSTLLQAIEAALFGVTVVPGKKENIPTWGQTNFSLELTFEVGGDAYLLVRSKSTAKLVKIASDADDDTLLANGNTPVTRYVEEMLGLTSKDFNLFVQSKQGETAGVLTFGASALNQKVEEFAGVSLIDAVQNKAQALAAASKVRAETLAVDEETLDDALTNAMNLEMVQDRADQEYENAQDLLAALPPLASVAPPVSAEDLSCAQRVAQRSQSALREAQAALSHAEESANAALEAVEQADAPVDVDQLNVVAKATRAELLDARHRLTRAQAELSKAVQLASDLEAARGHLEPLPTPETLLALTEAVQVAEADLSARADCLAVLKSKQSALYKMATDAVCPTCGTALSEHDPLVLAAEIAALDQSILEAAADHAASRIANAQAARALKFVETTASSHDAWSAKIKELEVKQVAVAPLHQQITELSSLAEMLADSVAAATSQVSPAEQINSRYALALKNSKARGAAVALAIAAVHDACLRAAPGPTEGDIAAATKAEADHRAAESEWKAENTRLTHALQIAKAELATATTLHESAKTTVAKLEERAATAKVSAEESALATRLARFLRDRRQAYLAEVWDVVMAAATRQVNTASGGLISRIAYNSGEFQFEEDGVLAPVTSASGAQKAHIGTAVRIGLARALYGANGLLILDEPTESMSERHALGLSASLVGAAKQTLLITHREQDQGLAANIIQVGV